MEHQERRGSLRRRVSLPISVLRDEKELAHGKTTNISRSGAYFRSTIPASLGPGMTVSVRIGLPVNERDTGSLGTITGRARVVRLEQQDEGCGIALHFSEEIDQFKE
jgi:hypothetical protein